MKTLQDYINESILDDEDVLVDDVKDYLKKIDNPINYFLLHMVDKIEKLAEENKTKLINPLLSNDDIMNDCIKNFFKFDGNKFKWDCVVYKLATGTMTINCSIRDITNNKLMWIEYRGVASEWTKIKLHLLTPQYIKSNFPTLYNDKYIKSYKSIINKLKKEFRDFEFDDYSSDDEWNVYYIRIKQK
jgi:hypothetical protein